MNLRYKIVFTALALVSFLTFAESVPGQTKKSPNKVVRSTKKPDEDRAHWKFLLDSLIVETRLVDPEQERPVVMADLADAYWLIDQQQAKKLFIDAFEAALAVKTDPPVARVVARVARRDRQLATELMKRRLADKSERDPEDLAETARELLNSDPKFAIELAKLSASLGPSFSSMSLLFDVARTDPAGATEIYNAHIRNLVRSGNPELRSLLWLAGYPLGYGEAYGGANDPSSLHGFVGMRVPGLRPQPDLAAAYLQIAFAAITNTLKKAAEAGNPDSEVLNALALYAASYLFPEVQRYLPNAEPAWSGLYRQALAGASENRRAAIEQSLRLFRERRGRTSDESPEDYARGDAKEKLEEIEKITDACKRDRSYTQAALAYSFARDFTQARQVVDRIDNLEQRAAVIQFINYDEALALIERDDLIRALERIEKVAAKEQRAVLYVKIATAASKKSDKVMVLDALNRAGALVRDSEDVQLQVGVLVSVSGVYARFDPAEATYATRESIKAINRSDARVDEPFSVFRQVNLACVGEISMQASNEKVETFNFYETLGAIAKTDAQAEGALALASEVQNRVTRIRAQLAIVKAVVK